MRSQLTIFDLLNKFCVIHANRLLNAKYETFIVNILLSNFNLLFVLYLALADLSYEISLIIAANIAHWY